MKETFEGIARRVLTLVAEAHSRGRPKVERVSEWYWTEVALAGLAHRGVGCSIGRHTLVHHGEYMSFGNFVRVGRYSRIGAVPEHHGQRLAPRLVLEDGVSAEWFTHIACAESIHIGRETMMAGGVFISDHDHGFRDPRWLQFPPHQRPLETAPVHIGQRCWLGEGVAVLPGATIGDEAVIGAGSVVTGDIPAGTVAVGAPARVVKVRDGEGRWSNVDPRTEPS